MTEDDHTTDWVNRANENIERWGNQAPWELLLALQEEIGEVANEMIDTDEPFVEDDRLNDMIRHHLRQTTTTGLAARAFLEQNFETPDGDPLPPEARPQSLDRDHADALAELHDAGPLAYQLRWALGSTRTRRDRTVAVHCHGPRGADCPCCDGGRLYYHGTDAQIASCSECDATFPAEADGEKMIVHIPQSIEYQGDRYE